jgi:peptide deformylase
MVHQHHGNAACRARQLPTSRISNVVISRVTVHLKDMAHHRDTVIQIMDTAIQTRGVDITANLVVMATRVVTMVGKNHWRAIAPVGVTVVGTAAILMHHEMDSRVGPLIHHQDATDISEHIKDSYCCRISGSISVMNWFYAVADFVQ